MSSGIWEDNITNVFDHLKLSQFCRVSGNEVLCHKLRTFFYWYGVMGVAIDSKNGVLRLTVEQHGDKSVICRRDQGWRATECVTTPYYTVVQYVNPGIPLLFSDSLRVSILDHDKPMEDLFDKFVYGCNGEEAEYGIHESLLREVFYNFHYEGFCHAGDSHLDCEHLHRVFYINNRIGVLFKRRKKLLWVLSEQNGNSGKVSITRCLWGSKTTVAFNGYVYMRYIKPIWWRINLQEFIMELGKTKEAIEWE